MQKAIRLNSNVMTLYYPTLWIQALVLVALRAGFKTSDQVRGQGAG